MDCLACNLNDLRKLVQTLTKRCITIEFVRERLSFTGEVSPLADPALSVMGAFTEFERALILERHRERIAIAKQRISRVQKIAFGCQKLRTKAVRCCWRAAGGHQHSMDRLAAQKIC
jgi:DNA invertase Pin-like site-specific DNA recombinase